MNGSDEDRAQILEAYRAMYRAMLDGRTDRLDALLDDQYSLTHITGYPQPKREWLSAVDSREMRYHSAEERSARSLEEATRAEQACDAAEDPNTPPPRSGCVPQRDAPDKRAPARRDARVRVIPGCQAAPIEAENRGKVGKPNEREE